MKVIIVDDEPLARSRIANLLKMDSDFNIIKECWNARQAIEVIERKRPDIIFLDIEMPEGNGFSVLGELDSEYNPAIIIVSAYNDYALKAFEFEVVDYIQKPFDEERFAMAINRTRKYIELQKTAELQFQIKKLLSRHESVNKDILTSFVVKDNGRLRYIPVEDVYCIEAYGNYVKLHLEEGYKVYRATMREMEEKLDPDRFTRIHRSYIVNVKRIVNIQYMNNNEYLFTLKNKHQIISSRSFKERIIDALVAD